MTTEGISLGFQDSSVDHGFMVPTLKGLTPRGHHARLPTLIQLFSLLNTPTLLNVPSYLTLIYCRPVNTAVEVYHGGGRVHRSSIERLEYQNSTHTFLIGPPASPR